MNSRNVVVLGKIRYLVLSPFLFPTHYMSNWNDLVSAEESVFEWKNVILGTLKPFQTDPTLTVSKQHYLQLLYCRGFALLIGEEVQICTFFLKMQNLKEIAELLAFVVQKCQRIDRGNIRSDSSAMWLFITTLKKPLCKEENRSSTNSILSFVQVDIYGFCVVVHTMLHGSYMEVEKKASSDGDFVYLPKSSFKRYQLTLAPLIVCFLGFFSSNKYVLEMP